MHAHWGECTCVHLNARVYIVFLEQKVGGVATHLSTHLFSDIMMNASRICYSFYFVSVSRHDLLFAFIST